MFESFQRKNNKLRNNLISTARIHCGSVCPAYRGGLTFVMYENDFFVSKHGVSGFRLL